MRGKLAFFWASLAYCTELFAAPGWHYFLLSVPSSDLPYILIDVQSSCPDRELLLGDSSLSPTASFNITSGLWETTAQYYELEGWVLAQSSHFLSFLALETNLYVLLSTAGVYLESTDCSHSAVVTYHGN